MIECLEKYISVYNNKIQSTIYFTKSTNKTPLITIHGGPGFCHNYLEPLHRLANERPVIFYDQLDCGQSDRPSNKENWTIDYYVDELETLIKTLKLEKVILYGHSWGAVIASEYALKNSNVEKLILASPYLSYSLWQATANKYIKKLKRVHRKAIIKGQEQGDYCGNEYLMAQNAYYQKYVTGAETLPSYYYKSAELAGREVYNYMWGPNEFTIAGTLKDYEIGDRLRELKIPVLFSCGKYDEASPKDCKKLMKKIINSKLAVFKKSAHLPHITKSEEYLTVIRNYLKMD